MERTFAGADELCILPGLEPAKQADTLARLAQEARLVRLALSATGSDANDVACCFERALGELMDADAESETERARLGLVSVLTEVRRAGLRLSASLDELTLDGVLGAQRLPVLTAVLAAD